jgi:hypothetical protein
MAEDRGHLEGMWIENPPCFFCIQPVMGTAVTIDGEGGRWRSPLGLYGSLRLMGASLIPLPDAGTENGEEQPSREFRPGGVIEPLRGFWHFHPACLHRYNPPDWVPPDWFRQNLAGGELRLASAASASAVADGDQQVEEWIENPSCFFCAQPVMGTTISRDGRHGRGYNPSAASLHATIQLMTGDLIRAGKASEYHRLRQQKRQAGELRTFFRIWDCHRTCLRQYSPPLWDPPEWFLAKAGEERTSTGQGDG